MAYRAKKYRSRRERNDTAARNMKLIFWFGLLAVAIWLFKHRLEYWAWMKIYFF